MMVTSTRSSFLVVIFAASLLLLVTMVMAAVGSAKGRATLFMPFKSKNPSKQCNVKFSADAVLSMVSMIRPNGGRYVKSELSLLKERLEKCPFTPSSSVSSAADTTSIVSNHSSVSSSDDGGLLGDIWTFLVWITQDIHDGVLIVTQDLVNIAYDFLEAAIIIPTALAHFIVQWLFWLIYQLIGLCPHCDIPGPLVTTLPPVSDTTTATSPTPSGGTSTVTYPDWESSVTTSPAGTSTVTYPSKVLLS